MEQLDMHEFENDAIRKQISLKKEKEKHIQKKNFWNF